MIINFALWSDPNLFGNFGSDLRDLTNPSLTAHHVGWQADQLAAGHPVLRSARSS